MSQFGRRRGTDPPFALMGPVTGPPLSRVAAAQMVGVHRPQFPLRRTDAPAPPHGIAHPYEREPTSFEVRWSRFA
jgi:hypothetical protein